MSCNPLTPFSGIRFVVIVVVMVFGIDMLRYLATKLEFSAPVLMFPCSLPVTL